MRVSYNHIVSVIVSASRPYILLPHSPLFCVSSSSVSSFGVYSKSRLFSKQYLQEQSIASLLTDRYRALSDSYRLFKSWNSLVTSANLPCVSDKRSLVSASTLTVPS